MYTFLVIVVGALAAVGIILLIGHPRRGRGREELERRAQRESFFSDHWRNM